MAGCRRDRRLTSGAVELGEGLGLVDLAVDVHAAQWGTLTRLVAATEAGMVRGGVAIDEHTALVVGEGALTVLGRGGLPPGLAEVPGLPPLGTVEMCLFGDAGGQSPLAEPLVRFLRESLADPGLAAAA